MFFFLYFIHKHTFKTLTTRFRRPKRKRHNDDIVHDHIYIYTQLEQLAHPFHSSSIWPYKNMMFTQNARVSVRTQVLCIYRAIHGSASSSNVHIFSNRSLPRSTSPNTRFGYVCTRIIRHYKIHVPLKTRLICSFWICVQIDM